MDIRTLIQLAKETVVTEKDVERINSKLQKIEKESSENEKKSQSDEFMNRKYTI